MLLSTALSLAALGVSLITAWFALFHRGSIKVTRPSMLALLRGDGPDPGAPKIFMRVLLYSTGKRGQAVESLFVKVIHGSASQLFLFWGYGETSELRVGSGLYVGPDGHTANHHFLLLPDASDFRLQAGDHKIELYCIVAGKREPSLLHSVNVPLTTEAAEKLRDDPAVAIYFNWNPDVRTYRSHIETRGRDRLLTSPVRLDKVS